MSNFIVNNPTRQPVSLDSGLYRKTVPLGSFISIQPKDLVGDYDLCLQLSAFATSGTLIVTRNSVTVSAADLVNLAQGSDMVSSSYDTDNDGVVDYSESQKVSNVTSIDDGDSPYSVLSTDKTILVDCSSAAVTVTLPAASSNSGKVLEIKDLLGDAGSNNITISPTSTDVIEGTNSSLVINKPFTFCKVYSDGSKWILLGEGLRTFSRVFTISPADSQADETGTACFTAPAAGLITAVSAQAGTGADTSETATVDVKIGGSTCLTGVITLDNAAGTVAQAGTIDAAADDIANGDAITFDYDWTTGGGTDTLAGVVITITYALS
jgi:hypothetical protein